MLSDHERAELERAYRDLGPGLWRAIYVFVGGQREITDDAVSHAFIEAAVFSDRPLPYPDHYQR